MGISPDVGGRQGLGRPLQLEYTELEATAQVADAKAALGIVPNSLDISFTELGGNPWKYQASASKPQIPMNVLQGIVYPDSPEASQLAQKQYERLLKELPLSIRQELKEQSYFPEEDRDLALAVFERLLRFTGKALAYLQTTSELQPENFAENNKKNHAHPREMLKEWIELTESTVQELDKAASLFKKGNQDLLRPLVKTCKEILQSNDKQGSFLAQRMFEELWTLWHHYEQKKIPNVLKLTGNLLHSLLLITASLNGKVTSSFLYATSSAMTALQKSFSKSGIWGRWQQETGKQLALTIDTSLPQQYLIEQIVQLVTISFVGLLSEAAGTSNSESGEEKTSATHSLAFLLASALLANSKVGTELAERSFEALEMPSYTTSMLTESTLLIAMNALILADAKGSQIMKGMQEKLMQGLDFLKEGSVGAQKELSIAIREAYLALEQENKEGYFDALQTTLKTFQGNLETLQEENNRLLVDVISLLQELHKVTSQNKSVSIVTQAA